MDVEEIFSKVIDDNFVGDNMTFYLNNRAVNLEGNKEAVYCDPVDALRLIKDLTIKGIPHATLISENKEYEGKFAVIYPQEYGIYQKTNQSIPITERGVNMIVRSYIAKDRELDQGVEKEALFLMARFNSSNGIYSVSLNEREKNLFCELTDKSFLYSVEQNGKDSYVVSAISKSMLQKKVMEAKYMADRFPDHADKLSLENRYYEQAFDMIKNKKEFYLVSTDDALGIRGLYLHYSPTEEQLSVCRTVNKKEQILETVKNYNIDFYPAAGFYLRSFSAPAILSDAEFKNKDQSKCLKMKQKYNLDKDVQDAELRNCVSKYYRKLELMKESGIDDPANIEESVEQFLVDMDNGLDMIEQNKIKEELMRVVNGYERVSSDTHLEYEIDMVYSIEQENKQREQELNIEEEIIR